MAHKKERFSKCTVCGAELKTANLLHHKAKTHAELLTQEEKAILSPKKAVIAEKQLPVTFAAWYTEAKARYLNEKRVLNGTIEDSIWSCITSALFEAAGKKDVQKTPDYDLPEIGAHLKELLDKFQNASRKSLQNAREKKERAQLRENIEVAKRALNLVEMLSLKEICTGVTCYLDRDILYPNGHEASYREAILINPYNVAARGNLAALLDREGRSREAEREYRSLRKQGM